MVNLTVRQLEPEIMDDPSLDPIEHRNALKGLARIHSLNNTPSQIWKTIRSRVDIGESTTLSIMDVGCGDGYLLRRLYRIAKREGIELRLIGCDFSSNAIEIGKRASSQKNIPVEFNQVDVTEVEELPTRADVVLCSLFLHHFTEQEAIGIFHKMNSAANNLVLIHDLRRTLLGYRLCWIGVHCLSRSKVVHKDGLLSVRAAFSIREIELLLHRAQINEAQILKSWPQRFTAIWSKTGRVE